MHFSAEVVNNAIIGLGIVIKAIWLNMAATNIYITFMYVYLYIYIYMHTYMHVHDM